MNAYELAKAQQAYSPPTLEEIIKQQADRMAELEKELSWWRTNFKLPTEPNSHRPNWLYAPQTKPLSDEEICKLFNEHTGLGVNQKEALQADLIVFARAIEERHGIK